MQGRQTEVRAANKVLGKIRWERRDSISMLEKNILARAREGTEGPGECRDRPLLELWWEPEHRATGLASGMDSSSFVTEKQEGLVDHGKTLAVWT